MSLTDINSEDRLVQQIFADHLENELAWESVYAWNHETFGPAGTLGRQSEQDVILRGHLIGAIRGMRPDLPEQVVAEAVATLSQYDFSRSGIQHNRKFYKMIRNRVPVTYRDDKGQQRKILVPVINFREPEKNRFVAVRELKIQGLRSPHYNRRADLVCFVNGLPIVFIELKAVYLNIRAAYDGNLTDYFDTIPHAFYHNAFIIVSNGDRAKYGSITSDWGRYSEWKRNVERDAGSVDAQILLDGMLAKERLIDLLGNFILFDDSKQGPTRKIIAQNHQYLGVNRAVGSVIYQEELKKEFPPDRRTIDYYPEPRLEDNTAAVTTALVADDQTAPLDLPLIRRSHPDLGRLGVFWQTQGSGKSYAMIFFVEKVRRVVPGNFTFVVMTDRDDLDGQILQKLRWLRHRGSQNHSARGEWRRVEAPPNRRPPVRLQPDPQIQSTRQPSRCLQQPRRHHRALGRSAPDSIGEDGQEHAPCAAKRGVPRFHRDSAVQERSTDPADFRQLHLTLRFKRSEEDGATVKLVYERVIVLHADHRPPGSPANPRQTFRQRRRLLARRFVLGRLSNSSRLARNVILLLVGEIPVAAQQHAGTPRRGRTKGDNPAPLRSRNADRDVAPLR